MPASQRKLRVAFEHELFQRARSQSNHTHSQPATIDNQDHLEKLVIFVEIE
jgi:hypothetical protein